ncbi:unnamed protein product [Closterium sp. NIES-54]
MAAAKRVLLYLCSNSCLGLVLGGRSPVVLTGHADASWVDDLATQRSSQGYTFSLGSGSVSWRSTRSSSVLSSSCEAEIYAGAMAAQELRWLTYLLTDLGEPPRSPPVLAGSLVGTVPGGGSGAGRGSTQRSGSGGGPRQQQQRGRETLSPQQLREWYTARQRGGGFGPCTYVLRTGDRTGEKCGGAHPTQRCFGRLTDAWRRQFPEATEIPRWGELSRAGVAIYDLDFDAILSAMYAVSISDEGDCYRCFPPDPGIETAALGTGEAAALGACDAAALGASTSASSGTGDKLPFPSSVVTVLVTPGRLPRFPAVTESEGLGFESQCVHFGHPSAGVCQRSTGDPRLILGKGYRLVVLGGYGRTDPLLNKPFYPNAVLLDAVVFAPTDAAGVATVATTPTAVNATAASLWVSTGDLSESTHMLMEIDQVTPPPPPSRPALSGVSHVTPPPLVEPLEVSSYPSGGGEGGDHADDDTATSHRSPRLETPPGFPPWPSSLPLQPDAVDSSAVGGGAGFGGAGSGGADSGGAGSRGVELPSGGGVEGTTSGGFAASGCARARGTRVEGAEASAAGGAIVGDARGSGAGGTVAGGTGDGGAGGKGGLVLEAMLLEVLEVLSYHLTPHSQSLLVTDSLTKRREPVPCPASPVARTRSAPRIRPPPVPGTHIMTLRPSPVPQRIVLPLPPSSSFPNVHDPESDLARAASPTVTHSLAALVT